MNIKKPLSIGLIVSLLLSMVMLAVPVTAKPAPAGGASIWVEPDYVNGSLVGYNNIFHLDVKVNISATCGNASNRGLFAYAFKLEWNNTLINLVSYEAMDYVPSNGVWEGGYGDIDKLETNGDMRRHVFGVSAKGKPTAFLSSEYVVADYNFRVVYQPIYPEPDGYSLLDLKDCMFVDSLEVTFAATAYDGEYEIFTAPPPTPMLEVKDPRDHDNEIERCNFPLGTRFNVTICIKQLHWAKYLRAWQASLEFDTTLLNITGVYNGTFLELWNGAFYVNVTHEEDGWVLTAASYLAEPTKDPGTRPPCAYSSYPEAPAQGVLMYVEFEVTNISIAPEMYECVIGLYDTILVDKNDDPIEHGIQANLTYYACYTTVGWYLDCTTDDFRKKCETPYIGVGPNITADAYEPQDLVILYAYLEYNKEPEVDKLVMFEIWGPLNPYDNITIFRTAFTNESGIATINFTIPWPWYNAREKVFGKWTCYQAAQVKIYQKPEDWLWFEVGWIIETLEVTAIDPIDQDDKVKELQDIMITIWFKNIMMIPKWVVFTITVYDELLDPIQEDVWGVLVAPATYGPGYPKEPYPSNPIPFVNYTVVLSEIPRWAHVGLATVYVNAFTALPKDCGCPYCPEITTTFWVIVTSDP